MNAFKKSTFRKGLGMCLIGITALLSGCGHVHEVAKQLPDGVKVAAHTSPYPISVLQNEHISLSFTKNNKPITITDLSVHMSMNGMKMIDKLNMSLVQLGKYQAANYEFSMSGSWVEIVRFKYGNELENMRFPITVSG